MKRERCRERFRKFSQKIVVIFFILVKMMGKPVTIKDFVRTLNISTSTVSRAMRDTHDVNHDTRKVVLKLSEELNYQSNQLVFIEQYDLT